MRQLRGRSAGAASATGRSGTARPDVTVQGVVGRPEGFLSFAGNLARVRRDEIDLVYRSGPEAVAALIAVQAARIDELVAANALLAARVEELERQAGRSSRNSSLPPSRDSPDARKQRPKNKGSGRRQGGQPGHRGQHRQMVAVPDRLVEHWPSACGGLRRADRR